MLLWHRTCSAPATERHFSTQNQGRRGLQKEGRCRSGWQYRRYRHARSSSKAGAAGGTPTKTATTDGTGGDKTSADGSENLSVLCVFQEALNQNLSKQSYFARTELRFFRTALAAITAEGSSLVYCCRSLTQEHDHIGRTKALTA